MDIILSPNFKLSEFLFSTSVEYNKKLLPDLYREQNFVSPEIVLNLYRLVSLVLQPIRDVTGLPIHVNSGFRCKRLNKRVGGVSDSQHLFGLAADITSCDNAKLLRYLKKNTFYDQLICYGDEVSPRFIHVSVADNSFSQRQQYIIKP